MSKKFTLTVENSNISVFDGSFAGDFNQWDKRHWEQGFSWREGRVTFRPLIGFGVTEVEVQQASEIKLAPKTQRAVLVPFTVVGKNIQVSSINYWEDLAVPTGKYRLIFENELLDEQAEKMWCRLTFIPTQEVVVPQILRADPLLSPEYPLLMEAKAA
jgi:Competence protein J (ComJ)